MELDVASDADLEEAPPEHFGSMTAPSGSSSPTGNGFGSATFGASTFTATPKRDTRELKAFGAHRGQSPGRTSAEVPASKNPTMQGNDGREPSPTAQRPTLTRAQTLADLPAHDDQAAVVSYEEGDPTSPSPRSGKTGMFKGKLDPFAIMKKKGKRESNTPDVPKSDKPEKSSGGIFGFQALSKITGAMSPKGRGDKREKSSEMEPSEERKRKEDQFWTRIEALKSDRAPPLPPPHPPLPHPPSHRRQAPAAHKVAAPFPRGAGAPTRLQPGRVGRWAGHQSRADAERRARQEARVHCARDLQHGDDLRQEPLRLHHGPLLLPLLSHPSSLLLDVLQAHARGYQDPEGNSC